MALFCSAQAFMGKELAEKDVTSAPYSNFSEARNISSEFCDKMNLLRLTFSINTWTSNQKVRRYKASSHMYWLFVYVSLLWCKSEAIWGRSALPYCANLFFLSETWMFHQICSLCCYVGEVADVSKESSRGFVCATKLLLLWKTLQLFSLALSFPLQAF